MGVWNARTFPSRESGRDRTNDRWLTVIVRNDCHRARISDPEKVLRRAAAMMLSEWDSLEFPV